MPTVRELNYARERYAAIRHSLQKADTAKLVDDIMRINDLDLKMIGRYSPNSVGRKTLEDLAAARKREMGGQ